MHYPTHSTSQIISITGAHMTRVSCHGFVDDHTDGIFGEKANRWSNRFSNESALFAMSDGSSCRINEFRRIGHPGAVRMSLFGTEGSFEQSSAGAVWVTKERDATVNLDEVLASTGVAATPDSAHTSDAPEGMGYADKVRLEDYLGPANGEAPESGPAPDIAALAERIRALIEARPLYFAELAEQFAGDGFQAVARALGELHVAEILWQDAEGRYCLAGSEFAAAPPKR